MGSSTALPMVLAEFQAAHPEVVLDVSIGRDTRQLEVGAFDVAIQLGLRRNPQLQARVLYRERLVASRAYLAAHGRPTSLPDLAHHRVIQARDAAGRAVPWHFPDGRPVPMPAPAALVNSLGFAHALARPGGGIARTGMLLAEALVATGELEVVFPQVWFEDPVTLLHAPSPTPVTRAFVAFMLGRFAERRAEGGRGA